MTPTVHSLPRTYLDAYELAEALDVSVRTIRLRARLRPWLLPARAELFNREMLRWRHDVVEAWLTSSKF